MGCERGEKGGMGRGNGSWDRADKRSREETQSVSTKAGKGFGEHLKSRSGVMARLTDLNRATIRIVRDCQRSTVWGVQAKSLPGGVERVESRKR